MPETLRDIHRKDVEELQKCLKPVKVLCSGIYTIHGISPTRREIEQYRAAVGELSKSMGKLPNGTYNVWLESQGNYHNLEVGTSGIEISSFDDLERAVEEIFSSVEKTEWRPRGSGEKHTQQDVESVATNLLQNRGDLELFDRITFFLYS